jgi:serpin B
MVTAFSDAADLSGMTGGRELFIAEVVHQAFISVDETGTEAAAATAAIAQLRAAPLETVQLTVDRPFLFAIEHTSTGEVLFLGQVTDPS